MSRLTSKLALAIWAAACAFLVLPAAAYAYVLPVCDADLATLAPSGPDAPDAPDVRNLAEPACSDPSRPDLELESLLLDQIQAELEAQALEGLGALCDERGVSALAPPRVRPIDDARIDAPPCSKSRALAAIAPAPDDAPRDAGLGAAGLDPALLPGPVVPPAAPEPELVDPLGRSAAVRPGFARSIDHPPR